MPVFQGLHTEVKGNIAFSLAEAVASTDGDHCSCCTVNLDKLAKQYSLLSRCLGKVSYLLSLSSFLLFVFSCLCSWFAANAAKPSRNTKKYHQIAFRALKRDSLRLQLGIKRSHGSISFLKKNLLMIAVPGSNRGLLIPSPDN